MQTVTQDYDVRLGPYQFFRDLYSVLIYFADYQIHNAFSVKSLYQLFMSLDKCQFFFNLVHSVFDEN